MADLSNTEEYLKERKRMCKTLWCSCCDLYQYNNGFGLSCDDYESIYPDKAIKFVESFVTAYPRETYVGMYGDKEFNIDDIESLPDRSCGINKNLLKLYKVNSEERSVDDIGRISIPKIFRDKSGMKAGQSVIIEYFENRDATDDYFLKIEVKKPSE